MTVMVHDRQWLLHLGETGTHISSTTEAVGNLVVQIPPCQDVSAKKEKIELMSRL
jgi:hypothetical protein